MCPILPWLLCCVNWLDCICASHRATEVESILSSENIRLEEVGLEWTLVQDHCCSFGRATAVLHATRMRDSWERAHPEARVVTRALTWSERSERIIEWRKRQETLNKRPSAAPRPQQMPNESNSDPASSDSAAAAAHESVEVAMNSMPPSRSGSVFGPDGQPLPRPPLPPRPTEFGRSYSLSVAPAAIHPAPIDHSLRGETPLLEVPLLAQ